MATFLELLVPASLVCAVLAALAALHRPLVFLVSRVRHRTRARLALALARLVLQLSAFAIVFSIGERTMSGFSVATLSLVSVIATTLLLLPTMDMATGTALLLKGDDLDFGDDIEVGTQRGRVEGFGLLNLRLRTAEGHLALLPYRNLARLGVRVKKGANASVFTFVLNKDGWIEENLELLQSIIVLSPYRQPGTPVNVDLKTDSVDVALSVARHGTESLAERQVKSQLDAERTRVASA